MNRNPLNFQILKTPTAFETPKVQPLFKGGGSSFVPGRGRIIKNVELTILPL